MRLHFSRRDFLKHTRRIALGILGLHPLWQRSSWAQTTSPNEKVQLAIIGCGSMGRAHTYALAYEENCDIVALCDCFTKRYEELATHVEKITGRKPDTYQDFRYVLDRKDIDAVFVVTPDHWHPLMTILACQAGKDVYVEKPVCPTVREGRAMVEAARRYGRVVQVGTQQRSMPVFQKAIEIIQSGKLGTITTASAWIGTNFRTVEEHPSPIPEGLDWDMWLGPAPYVPYSPERHYGFMMWHDYCRGGELTNWGTHLMDVIHWGIGEDSPLTIQAIGGNYRDMAGAENYENIEAIFEFKGCNVTWEQRHSPGHEKGYGIQFHGTNGRLIVDRASYQVYPSSLGIPEFVGEPERSWANVAHHQNFFECIRTRKRPVADIEQGFRATTTVLLAGIALKVRRKLEWDAKREQFVNDEEANRYLTRAYRYPWRLP